MKFMLVFTMLLSMATACVRPEKRTMFSDFARRADVVLRAEVLSTSPINTGVKGSYNATFRIIGLFSLKSENFAVGDTISLGPFGHKSTCADVRTKTKHILFLRKLRYGESGVKASYGLRYNPVPDSNRNTFFFGRLLAGKILRSNILISGCRALKRPQNGKIQCTTMLDRCRIMCERGYKLTGSSKYKTCDILTGIWLPSGQPQCEVVSAGSTPNKKSGGIFTVIQNIMKNAWSPQKRVELSFRDEEVEEEEEEINEDVQHIRKARKPWKPSVKYTQSATREQEEEEEDEKEELPRIQVSKPSSNWNKQLLKNILPQKEIIEGTKSLEIEEQDSNSTVVVKQQPISLKSSIIKINSVVSEDITTPLHLDEDIIKDEHLLTLLKLETLYEEKNNSLTNQTSPQTTEISSTNPIQQISYEKGRTGDSWLRDGVLYRPLMLISGAVFGCPTYKGTVTIHSSWHNGFTGDVHFPALKNPILGGWITRIVFNMEVQELETYTVNFLAVTHNKYEYCFISKNYNSNIYFDQDLTLSFVGKIRESIGNTYPQIKGTAELLGYCALSELKEKKVGTMVPTGYIGSLDADIWDTVMPQAETEDKNVESKPELLLDESFVSKDDILFAERCLTKTRNGGFPSDEKLVLKWKRTKFRGSQLLKKTSKDRDYNEVIHKSILFFESQKSGIFSMRNRILWRTNSDVKDGCSLGVDLTGGWYCGSGNVKNTFLIAYSASVLIWGAIDYFEAYRESGEIENLEAQIRWATDYLMKCHLSRNVLVVQIGKYLPAARDWNRPEDSDARKRTVYKINEHQPGSDVASETSAALAAASIYFQESDPEYSKKCLQHAEQLFQFADNFQGSYSSTLPRSATRYFTWNGIDDELAWGALWLYMATLKPEYLDKAERLYKSIDTSKNIFQWDDKTRGLTLLLAKITKKSKYTDEVNFYVNWLIDNAKKDVNGLVWINQWGPTMHAANAGFLALQALEYTKYDDVRQKISNFSRSQMEILVGGVGDGFVVGIGSRSPRNPHHRGSTCPVTKDPCNRGVLYDDQVNPNILYGAMVAGPDKYGRYTDIASNYVSNEVSIGFNAGLQSLSAGLKQQQINQYRT